jgi:hypothetical protein
MKKISLLAFLAIIIFSSCKKTIVVSQLQSPTTDSTTQNKEVRIDFPVYDHLMGWANSQDDLTAETYIYDFNKDDYPGMDSITFVFDGSLRAGALVRLVNITDNIIIANSIIKTNLEYLGELHSNNIYNSLPPKKITMGIRYLSGKTFSSAGTIQGAFIKVRSK